MNFKKYMYISILLILLIGVVCASSTLGKPIGYVGGCVMPNGDIKGGHPDNATMLQDEIEGGMLEGGVNYEAWKMLQEVQYENVGVDDGECK